MNVIDVVGITALVIGIIILVSFVCGYIEYRLKFKSLFDDLEKHIQKTKENKPTDKNTKELKIR